MSEYIHGSSPEEQQRLSVLNDLINARCIGKLGLRGGEKILDVGSGLGQFTMMMAGKAGSAGSCLGVERDVNQLEQAKKNLAASNILNVEFRKGDAEDLQLKENEVGSFDVAHTRFLLEHLNHPENAVHQMVSVVRSGGKIVLADDDHTGFALHPEVKEFPALWTAYMRTYEILGNDPNIGRKLVKLLYDQGLTTIRNDVVFFGDCAGTDTFKAFSENLVNVIGTGQELMIKEKLISENQYEQAIQALKQWAAIPYASLWYTIFWAEGIKK